MRVKELFAFIKERHAIYERRLAGKPKPWTKDPILQQYRFCNVYRELDTVTVWIRENWREPWDWDPNLWFTMAVARLVNWPESLDDLSYAVLNSRQITWQPAEFIKVMDRRKKAGKQTWSGAYMIHSGVAETKAQYIADEVLTPLWKDRGGITNELLELNKNKSLLHLYRWLMEHKDFGSFMAAQVVADVKFQTCWKEAKDWWTFAAPGPGSLRGMSRVEFGDLGTKYADLAWNESLQELQRQIDPLVKKAGMLRISAQDLQNCLCEWDKYERTRLGEGKPRSKYPGV